MGGCTGKTRRLEQGNPTMTENVNKIEKAMVTEQKEENNTSLLKLKLSELGVDIFQRASNPVENQKIIDTFRSISKNLSIDDSDKYKFNGWRVISFPNSTLRGEAICAWSSDGDRALNGPSILYFANLQGSEFLVVGTFQNFKLTTQRYYKILANGAYYEGELNQDYLPHGYGTLRISEDEYYTGNFHMGVPHGDGEKAKNGKKYIGRFKNGEIIKGKQITEKGRYEGEFKNYMRHGKGILQILNGPCYEGQFANSKRSGEGTLYDKDRKIIYQGKWSDDKQCN